jgi:hypothetical protein
MPERDWTDDAELLARALDAGENNYRSGWQEPDGNDVTIDGTYDASAVLNFIRAAAWDEGFDAGARDAAYETGMRNPYRTHDETAPA